VPALAVKAASGKIVAKILENDRFNEITHEMFSLK